MQDTVISLQNITKMYGSSRGVVDISLSVPRGSVYGFLGPNGAGKTTTISVLMNLLKPTSGKAEILGRDITRHGLELRHQIGFLSGDMALSRHMTGHQQLQYFGKIYGRYNRVYVSDLASRFDCNLNRKIRSLSRGNRQKIALIAALMHHPEVLILDEPTSGLDPLIQAEFNKLILEHRDAGKTVFISSHILSEVEELCDRIAIIRAGRIIAEKTMDQIRLEAPKIVRIGCDTTPQALLAGIDGATNISQENGMIEFEFDGDVNRLISRLGRLKLSYLAIGEPDLDDIFMNYYHGEPTTQPSGEAKNK